MVVAASIYCQCDVLKGRFSIRTTMSQFKHLGIVVNVHLVSLLWVGKYQKYLQKPGDKLSKIRYPIPNSCAPIPSLGTRIPNLGAPNSNFGWHRNLAPKFGTNVANPIDEDNINGDAEQIQLTNVRASGAPSRRQGAPLASLFASWICEESPIIDLCQ